MADDLKRSGGFLPGIRPGKETADYLDTILSRITLPGSLFLAFLAILPAIIVKAGVQPGMGNVLWRNIIVDYGWSCNRYHSTNQFIFVESSL